MGCLVSASMTCTKTDRWPSMIWQPEAKVIRLAAQTRRRISPTLRIMRLARFLPQIAIARWYPDTSMHRLEAANCQREVEGEGQFERKSIRNRSLVSRIR